MRFSVVSSFFAVAATTVTAGPVPHPRPIGKSTGGPLGALAAPPPPPDGKPTFLMVPGAWYTAPAFNLIRAQLTNRGFESGVPEDAAAIQAELKKLVDAGKDVIVLSHFYGSVPAAAAVEGFNAKDRAAKNQKGGVGSSLIDSLGGNPLPWFNITGDILTPIDPTKVFYAAIKPSSLRAMTDKGTFAPWDQRFEIGFIHTKDDQAILIANPEADGRPVPRRPLHRHP
ncbi:Alpha/Beta hydrolase protein [Apiospora arundinis]|uniref:Alpha/Beta hydrolase protein n=1 Tax=Apiospora arundinis TaxID=335852 RepID=A0ABR2HQE3_9PEZI